LDVDGYWWYGDEAAAQFKATGDNLEAKDRDNMTGVLRFQARESCVSLKKLMNCYFE
jgi:hypothetical protein